MKASPKKARTKLVLSAPGDDLHLSSSDNEPESINPSDQSFASSLQVLDQSEYQSSLLNQSDSVTSAAQAGTDQFSESIKFSSATSAESDKQAVDTSSIAKPSDLFSESLATDANPQVEPVTTEIIAGDQPQAGFVPAPPEIDLFKASQGEDSDEFSDYETNTKANLDEGPLLELSDDEM